MAKVGPRLQTIGHELVLPTKGQPCHILHPNNLRGGMGHAGLLLFCREGLKWGVGLRSKERSTAKLDLGSNNNSDNSHSNGSNKSTKTKRLIVTKQQRAYQTS